MEGKKKLKKLTLRKESIINLNDYEMNIMRGGTDSALACATAVVSAVTAVVETAYQGYELGVEKSWWDCPYSQQKDCMSDASKIWSQDPQLTIKICQLPEIVIYGI